MTQVSIRFTAGRQHTGIVTFGKRQHKTSGVAGAKDNERSVHSERILA
jgi:hypothetical protein